MLRGRIDRVDVSADGRMAVVHDYKGRRTSPAAKWLAGGELVQRVGLEEAEAVERGSHTEDLAPLWEEMTMVRRSAPAGAQW